MHDPRVGRFFAVDPLFKKYPWNSSYAFSENKVVNSTELEGLESEPAIEVAEETTKSALKVVWNKEVAAQATKSTTFGAETLSFLGNLLGFISMFMIDDSPSFGTTNEIESPYPSFFDIPEPDIDNNFDDDDDYILLYRGVSDANIIQYNEAKKGRAVPKGLLDNYEGEAHNDMDLHAMGDNYSIWTSWTTNENTAEVFSHGPKGDRKGVVLSKIFKRSEVQLNTSNTAKLLQEDEYLVPGVVEGAAPRETKPTNN